MSGPAAPVDFVTEARPTLSRLPRRVVSHHQYSQFDKVVFDEPHSRCPILSHDHERGGGGAVYGEVYGEGRLFVELCSFYQHYRGVNSLRPHKTASTVHTSILLDYARESSIFIRRLTPPTDRPTDQPSLLLISRPLQFCPAPSPACWLLTAALLNWW